MNYAILWTARWTRKLLDFLFRIRLRAASQGCRNLLRTSARKGATGTEPRIRTVRQLAAAAGDGSLGFAGSPGQLETSLNSGYLVGPCNSYLEGPTLVFGHCSHPFVWACCSRNRALSDCSLRSQRCSLGCRRRRCSQRKERLCSLLLRAAARDLPTLAAHVTAPSPTGARDFRRSPQATPPLPDSALCRPSFVEAPQQQSRSMRQH
jgi:hypothetical protein